MKNNLQKELMHSIFRFKKMLMTFPPRGDRHAMDVSMSELCLMRGIADNTLESSGEKIQAELCITKGAVSQMLGALEKKGYIIRAVNQDNRRKIIISLTEKGNSFLQNVDSGVNAMFAEIIKSFGREDTRQFISLINRFADISEDIKALIPGEPGNS